MTLSKEAQQRYRGIAAGTSSGLSMIGSVYILGRYWYARRMKSKATGAGTGHHIDVTKELIHVLAWLDLVGAAGRCFGVLPTQTFDQSKREPVTSVCQLQAFVITFGDVSPIAWNFLMAFNLFRWVCRGEDQQMLQRRIKWYIFATLLFTLAIDTLALGFNVYGDAGQWCWVVIPNNRPKELAWKLITLYVWVLLGAVAMGVLLVMVKMNVQDRLRGVDNDDARVAYHGVVQNLTIYIVAFIVCWMPAVLDRGYSAITGRDVFTLSMLHTAIVPLQGFVNAVIYGKFHVWVGRHLQQPKPGAAALHKSSKSSSSMDGDAQRPTHVQDQRARQQSGTASIFVTSFDMNWHETPLNLADWIPRDHDLYVFSLQKCISVQHAEQAIRKHLLQINYPMGYRSITSLAGAQPRGHMQAAAVCQIVFVNNSDIASGNFQFQTGDGRLWSQRKAFKGVVGIPMRYFEASLAFVSCNLSAVSSSQSPHHLQMPQAPQDLSLAGKHATTMGLIQSFEMDADRAAVDFPYLYHHTILAGNFNYNIGMPCARLTMALDQAYKAECLKRATDAALNVKLRNFGQSPLDGATRGSPTALGLQPIGGLEPTNSNVNVEWNLLYFKTRRSLGRASYSSNSSGDDDDGEYEEVFSADHDGLRFTQLRSPARTTETMVTTTTATSFVPVSQPCRVSGSSDGHHVQLEIAELQDGERREERSSSMSDGRHAWLGFLNNLFPSSSPVPLQRKTSRSAATSADGAAVAAGKRRGDLMAAGRGESTNKKVGDWMLKSQLVAESSQRKWQELLRQDELRAGMEAKEILCGFEEPPIAFLPSFPRRVGTAASYSMFTQQRNCKDVFVDPSEGLPAYKDRILIHSLPDTRQRIRNVGYWLCEDITTSTHKPVCSVFELEIDRFFSFTNTEADKQDVKEGKLALKDKTHIAEYKIKLVNLDANIWTYVPVQRHSSIPLWRLRTPTPDAANSSSSTGGAAGGSATEQLSTRSAGSAAAATPAATPKGSDTGSTVSDTVHALEQVRSIGSFSTVLGKMKRKSSSSSASRGASALTRTGSQSGVSGGGVSSSSTSANRRGRLDSLSCDQFDLVPVDPSSIATVFPLPSEDVYALQRKIHEVAYSVQNGFQSSARDEESEEASLAYTNFRTVSWKEAMAHGVMHTAITKAVNGVVHVAIKIEGDGKKHGGQGILCIQEQDLIAHAAASIGDADPIPFDLALTWGGRHVGYLHGDILSSL